MLRVHAGTGICFAVAVLLLTQGGCAARRTAFPTAFTAQPSLQPATAPKPEPPPGTPQEGVKVHGHWTVEVHNADGSLASHNEFENALFSGAFLLGPILGRAYTVGGWQIYIFGPCFTAITNACIMVESTDPLGSAPSIFKTLTVSAPLPNTPGSGTMTLSGAFTAQLATQISLVATAVNNCDPTVAPASCPPSASSNSYYFSKATIAPIAVSAGQVVQVTVVFSFS